MISVSVKFFGRNRLQKINKPVMGCGRYQCRKIFLFVLAHQSGIVAPPIFITMNIESRKLVDQHGTG